MPAEFDTRGAVDRLEKIIVKYKSERLELYEDDTYIADILFFIGKSIDAEKYGHDARTFQEFLATRVFPIAAAAKTTHKKNFARKLGMRT